MLTLLNIIIIIIYLMIIVYYLYTIYLFIIYLLFIIIKNSDFLFNFGLLSVAQKHIEIAMITK